MDSFNRRNFLKTAGAVAAGSALADVPAAAVPFPLISVDMLAEGILNGILATSLPTLPPGLEGRVRYKSPSSINGGKLRRDLLEVHVFAWPAVAELPLAIPPTPLPISQGGPTISLFYVEINDIRLAKNPQYYPWGINSAGTRLRPAADRQRCSASDHRESNQFRPVRRSGWTADGNRRSV